MALSKNFFSKTLVVTVSSRALFQCEKDAMIFHDHGLDAYIRRQRRFESKPFEPGAAFPLVRGLLELNRFTPPNNPPLVEVIIVSSQHPDTGVRIMESVKHHGLDITRAAFTGSGDSMPYIMAFKANLVLTKSAEDAQRAIDNNIAAALMYDPPDGWKQPVDEGLRIAFDGDSVLFDDQSEVIYKRDGFEAFQANETLNARVPMPDGPHGGFLVALNRIKKYASDNVRIALITARSAPAHERALITLRSWGVCVDEAVFLGGLPKTDFLIGFGAHIFFDDQPGHLNSASRFIPSGMVPYRSCSLMDSNLPKFPRKAWLDSVKPADAPTDAPAEPEVALAPV